MIILWLPTWYSIERDSLTGFLYLRLYWQGKESGKSKSSAQMNVKIIAWNRNITHLEGFFQPEETSIELLFGMIKTVSFQGIDQIKEYVNIE